LTRERWRTFTTNFVLAETHALFLRRLSHAHATTFLREFPRRSTTLIRVESEDEERAQAIIFAYQDKQFSYTDGTSFAVMERLGISYGFSFDRDFAEYGVPVLTP
jgi:predicted nucleic acid-binding protein